MNWRVFGRKRHWPNPDIYVDGLRKMYRKDGKYYWSRNLKVLFTMPTNVHRCVQEYRFH
jgi:hypothetical protein